MGEAPVGVEQQVLCRDGNRDTLCLFHNESLAEHEGRVRVEAALFDEVGLLELLQQCDKAAIPRHH